MTGVDDPYEEPTDAELVLDTSDLSVERRSSGCSPTWKITAGWSFRRMISSR